jgi:hypothetical protein
MEEDDDDEEKKIAKTIYDSINPTLPLPGPQPTTPGHYTTCCKSQSYAPEDGQKVARNMLS